MRWLERSEWWLLLALARPSAVFGLGDLLIGMPEYSGRDGGDERRTSPRSGQAYRLIEVGVRAGGLGSGQDGSGDSADVGAN